MSEEVQERAAKEMRRLNKIMKTGGVSDARLSALRPVVENAAWMLVKLEDARQAIRNAQIVITYDNGGGQKGIRENPLFRGYEALWKSYMLGMREILSALPPETAEKVVRAEDKPKNVLSIVRARHVAQ